jgi:ergothioneine biosynthesis protein EgtB
VRGQRGLVTRPDLATVQRYRSHVDAAVIAMLSQGPTTADISALVELGLQHEQQHQELMLTDLQHLFWCNPLAPAYVEANPTSSSAARSAAHWLPFAGGLHAIGAEAGEQRFAFDNETPRHQVWLEPFALHNRLVTNAEYQQFIDDDGYQRPDLWLSLGWATAQQENWQAPLYWRRANNAWQRFSLHGEQPIEPDAPVCHVSFFEADAFARWSHARLPLEAEWEIAATSAAPGHDNLLASGYLRPRAVTADGASTALQQMFGDVWEWTASAYAPYPGFRSAPGAVGEYNGKFMSQQYVLRGGSCVTPADHIRATYRNFFPPQTRWQWSGIRLARDGHANTSGPATLHTHDESSTHA